MNQKLIVVSATYRPQRALTDNLSEACCLPKLYDAWVSNLSTYVLLPLCFCLCCFCLCCFCLCFFCLCHHHRR